MDIPSLPSLPCLCANLRRASRAVSQVYEEALRPVGLRATQFTLLQSLSQVGEVTQGALGEILALDSTTLTRTLLIMIRQEWITKRRGEDRREWLIRLSKRGEGQFRRALPHWQAAQTRLRAQMGEVASDNLMKLTKDVTNLAINQ